MECHECDKETFLSKMLARNAAYLYNLIYGKEYDLYECPVRKGDFHLTTGRWRRKTNRGAKADCMRPRAATPHLRLG